jgi:Subtilase family
MRRKHAQALSVFIFLLCHEAHAEYESEPPCGQLLPKPASYVEPRYIIDDPTLPALGIEEPVSPSAQYRNVDAQWTHGVQRLRFLHNVYGQRSVVGVWDEAAVLGDHYQFLNAKGSVRVRPLWSKGQKGFFGDDPKCKDDPTKQCYSQHSTHVAGTIGSGGFEDSKAQSGSPQPLEPSKSEGMAPRVGIYSFNWFDDALELCHAASGDGGIVPIHVSNHSYGPVLGWTWECTDPAQTCSETTWTWHGAKGAMKDERFGQYEYDATNFDKLIYSRRNLSVFRSAGNDRRDDPTKMGGWWDKPYIHNIYLWDDKTPIQLDKSQFPKNGEYKLVKGAALAKNVITIGAIEKIPDAVNSGPEMITPAKLKVLDFSNAGPRADGAIKPDLVAAGGALLSPTISSKIIRFPDIAEKDRHYYKEMSGTSMATPAIAGIATLLNEVAVHKMRRVLRADEMKALLIHTAINNSANTITPDAPNYETGWGSVRADYAGWILDSETAKRKANSAERMHWIGVYEEAFPGGFLVKQGDAKTPFSMSLDHIPGKNVRVTLVWLDEPGPKLVNDLDLVVRGPTRTQHRVWCLDGDHPAEPAWQCGRNNRDNVERVDVKAGVEAVEGTWTIEVGHVNGSKSIQFALVVSGFERKGAPPVTVPNPEPPPLPEQVCQACYDFPLRDAPYAGSPPQVTVFQCDPVRVVKSDPNRPWWAYVTFRFPPFHAGFSGIPPGPAYPWNRGWAPRSAIACRGDGRRCPCTY